MYTVISFPIVLSIREIEKTCRFLKNRKAPEPGNISAELVKYGTAKLYEQLRILFQNCINGMEVPNEWKSFLISSYIKKEAKIATTRGIAVTSSVRIYGKILKQN